MRDGKYKISTENKKVIYLTKDKKTGAFVKNHFKNNDTNSLSFDAKIKKFFKNALPSLLNRRNLITPTKSKGSILMISWDNDLKIFDLEENIVLTFYSDKSKFKRYLEDTNYFSKYFNITFLEKNEEESLIKESLINNAAAQLDSKREYHFRSLIDQYTNYFQNVSPKDYMNFNKIDQSIYEEWKYLFKGLKGSVNQDILDLEIPMFYMHSDLHFDNVLISEKDEVYLIDWEHSSIRPFFYDVYNVLFVEVLNHNRNELVLKYINGEFDSNLIKLFNSGGIRFNPKFREIYLLLFIIYRFLYFDLVNNEKQSVITRYEKLLKRLSFINILGNNKQIL